jgi:PBP1b-binding outer membrane lipoprotein LpoB
MKKIILLVISVCFLQACKNDVKTTEDSSENSTTETPTEQTTAQKLQTQMALIHGKMFQKLVSPLM